MSPHEVALSRRNDALEYLRQMRARIAGIIASIRCGVTPRMMTRRNSSWRGGSMEPSVMPTRCEVDEARCRAPRRNGPAPPRRR